MNPPRWGLGRRPSPPDDRDYKLADYLKPALGVFAMSWQHGPILDQGASPTCCGHGGAAWGDCLPVDDNWGEDVALALYAECKAIDGDNQDGSTVRSLAKALKARGRLSKYAFGTLAEARAFILAQGPVILGIDWTDDMFMPDGSGVVHAGGPVAGGHCLLAFGADESYCFLQNSWGTAWGTHGCCKISWADLAKVFAGGGEAVDGGTVCARVGRGDIDPRCGGDRSEVGPFLGLRHGEGFGGYRTDLCCPAEHLWATLFRGAQRSQHCAGEAHQNAEALGLGAGCHRQGVAQIAWAVGVGGIGCPR